MPAGQSIGRFAVGTTATRILRAGTVAMDVHVSHTDGLGAAFFAFDSNVRAQTGFPLPANRGHVRLVVEAGNEIWAVGTAASDVVSVMYREMCRDGGRPGTP